MLSILINVLSCLLVHQMVSPLLEEGALDMKMPEVSHHKTHFHKFIIISYSLGLL